VSSQAAGGEREGLRGRQTPNPLAPFLLSEEDNMKGMAWTLKTPVWQFSTKKVAVAALLPLV
jgi:hypothetical protein